MKAFKKILYLFSLSGLMATVACTEVENLEVEHIGGYNTIGDSEYYENLRAYKESAKNYGRPVAFGWFSNWSPAGTYRRGYLTSMPDSMDIVSMWSGAPGPGSITPEQKADKEFVQKVKGTKLLEVSLLSYMGKGRTPDWVYAEVEQQAKDEGWSESQLNEARKQARWKFWGFEGVIGSDNYYESMDRYAKALCDSLFAGEWDGYDIDWEIGSGVFDMDGTLSRNDQLIYLVKEMNKYIGPMSDPEGKGHKLLCIDGGFTSLVQPLEGYVDYWIKQSYGSSRPSLEYGTDPKKIIITDNFESSAASGGVLLQQAAHMPANGYKGGVGAYRFDNDYDNTPDYKWMRQAIQINQRVFNEWKASQSGEGESQK